MVDALILNGIAHAVFDNLIGTAQQLPLLLETDSTLRRNAVAASSGRGRNRPIMHRRSSQFGCHVQQLDGAVKEAGPRRLDRRIQCFRKWRPRPCEQAARTKRPPASSPRARHENGSGDRVTNGRSEPRRRGAVPRFMLLAPNVASHTGLPDDRDRLAALAPQLAPRGVRLPHCSQIPAII